MWPYFLFFLIIVLVGFSNKALHRTSESNITSWPSWLFLFIILVLMIGLRYRVGADWNAYWQHVEDLRDKDIAIALSMEDPAYYFLNWIGANWGGGIYLVNIICASVFSFGLIFFCKSLSRPLLGILAAIPYLVVVVAMGYSRQSVAIGFEMIAIIYLLKNKIFTFIFLVGLASMFHKSAMLFVLLALFVPSRNFWLVATSVITTGSILMWFLFQKALDGLYYGYINTEYAASGANIRAVMNVMSASILLIFRKKILTDAKIRVFWIWMARFAILYIPVLIFSPSSNAADRIALYLIPLQLFVWGELPKISGGRYYNFWYWFAALYSFTVLTVWLLYADNSGSWIPYYFYPIKND